MACLTNLSLLVLHDILSHCFRKVLFFVSKLSIVSIIAFDSAYRAVVASSSGFFTMK
jgi:hypothetical protein